MKPKYSPSQTIQRLQKGQYKGEGRGGACSSGADRSPNTPAWGTLNIYRGRMWFLIIYVYICVKWTWGAAPTLHGADCDERKLPPLNSDQSSDITVFSGTKSQPGISFLNDKRLFSSRAFKTMDWRHRCFTVSRFECLWQIHKFQGSVRTAAFWSRFSEARLMV